MLPKQRISKTRKLNRRSHHAIKPTGTAVCPNCGSLRRPHSACGNCGYVRPGLSIKTNEED
ncbi:MAG: 50S ribosomal protein L32 [Planctomycetota bacterium]